VSAGGLFPCLHRLTGPHPQFAHLAHLPIAFVQRSAPAALCIHKVTDNYRHLRCGFAQGRQRHHTVLRASIQRRTNAPLGMADCLSGWQRTYSLRLANANGPLGIAAICFLSIIFLRVGGGLSSLFPMLVQSLLIALRPGLSATRRLCGT
jgi:hypothetical protein